MENELSTGQPMPAKPERAVISYSRERSEDFTRGADSSRVVDSGTLPVFGDKTLRDYLDILKSHQTLALVVFFAVFSAVALYAFLVTPVYRSYATIMVQDRSSRDVDPKAMSANELAFDRYMDTEVGTLRSRAVAGQVVTRMNLAESSEFRSWTHELLRQIITDLKSLVSRADPDDPRVEAIRREDATVRELEKRLSVRQVGKGQLLEVGMSSSSPQMAQAMLKTYLDIYIETKLNIERKGALDALRWLKDEIEHAQIGIIESEAALIKFIAEHGIVPSDDGGLAEVVDMIKKKREGLIKAHELKAKLQGIEKGGASTRYNTATEVTEDEVLKRLKDNLASLESEYNQLIGTYSKEHPKVLLLKRRIRMLEERIVAIQNQSVASALEAAQKEAEVLSTGVKSAKDEVVRIGSLGAQYAILKKDVDINKQLHQILLKDYKETLVKSRTGRVAAAVADSPNLPLTPVWPRKGLLLVVGSILGVFGAGLAVFTSHVWESTRDATTQLEHEFKVAKLGMVPDVTKLSKFHPVTDSGYEFLSYDLPISPLADSIRNIHASILFATVGREDIKSVLVSSAAAGEGKTFISVSLATALTCNNSRLSSCTSKRVLVVDCDMRRPNIHNVFRTMVNSTGLTTLLTSHDLRAESAVRKHDSIPGLFYMTAGPAVPDPAALLMSDRFGEIAEELQRTFDFIVFDSPPVLGFPDSRILGRHSDGVVLVVEEGRLNPGDLRTAISALASAPGGPILGLILNKTRPDRTHLMYGAYYYGRNGGNNHG